MHGVLFLCLIVLLTHTPVWGIGNETINVLPDSNKREFREQSREFWKEEFSNRMAEIEPIGHLVSGGYHDIAGTCISPSFATVAMTNQWNRVQASQDGTGGAKSIDYTAVGVDGCQDGSTTARVAICAVSGNAINNFHRAGDSNYFVNHVNAAPDEPTDCLNLMDVTIEDGAIVAVTQLQRPSDLGWTEVGHIGVRNDNSKAPIAFFVNTEDLPGGPAAGIWHPIAVRDLGMPYDVVSVFLSGILIITHGTTVESCDVTVALRAPGDSLSAGNYIMQTIEASVGNGQRSGGASWAPVKDGVFEIQWNFLPAGAGDWPLHCSFGINLSAQQYVRRGGATAQTVVTPPPTPGGSVGIINVVAFGALGNDNTAETAGNNVAFQAALDAVDAVYGNTVYVPPGVYCLGTSLWIKHSRTRFIGAGGASRIKTCINWTTSPLTGVPNAQILLAHASITNGPTGATHITDVEISDIEIIGLSHVDVNAPKGITSVLADRVKIANVTFTNQPREVIIPMSTQQGTDWKVLGSTFNNTGQNLLAANAGGAAVVMNAQGFTVAGSSFNSVATAINTGIGSTRSIVTSNQILLPTIGAIEIGGIMANTGVAHDPFGSDHSQVIGNTIVMNGDTFTKRAIAVMENSRDVKLLGNNIRLTTALGGSQLFGIALHGPNQACGVEDNTMYMDVSPGDLSGDNKLLGIFLEGGPAFSTVRCGLTANKVRIINNTGDDDYGAIYLRTVAGETAIIEAMNNIASGFTGIQHAFRIARTAGAGTLTYAATNNVAEGAADHEYGDLGSVCTGGICNTLPVSSNSGGATIFIDGGTRLQACQALSALGTPPTPITMRCCSNCFPATNPCASGGGGALAYSMGGTWICP
jgi:hypothetical protein